MSQSRSQWQPKLVALDVDGTLLSPENFYGKPTKPVVQAVLQAHRSGAHVVLATGRSWYSTIHLLDHLDLAHGYVVSSNGAVVSDISTRAPVEVATFDASAAVRHFTQHIPDALLAVDEMGGGFRVSGEFLTGELDGTVTVVEPEKLVSGPTSRMLVRWPGGDLRQLKEAAYKVGLPNLGYTVKNVAWLDISPRGVSKTIGVTKIAEKLGVSVADTLAVGDGHNDIGLLTWAGRGVAMGQSPDDVKAVADEVCGSVESDGLANLLHTYFPPTD